MCLILSNYKNGLLWQEWFFTDLLDLTSLCIPLVWFPINWPVRHLFHCSGLILGSLVDSYLVCCSWPAWIPAQHELPFRLPRSYCYSKLSKECLQGRAAVSQLSLNHPVLFCLEICVPCRHCNTSPVLTVTGKMVKTTEWDRPLWALQWEVPLFAPAKSSSQRCWTGYAEELLVLKFSYRGIQGWHFQRNPRSMWAANLLWPLAVLSLFPCSWCRWEWNTFVGKQSTLLEA